MNQRLNPTPILRLEETLAAAGLVQMYKKHLTLELICCTPFIVSNEPAVSREEFFNVVEKIRGQYPNACIIDDFLLDQKTGHDMAVIAVWDGDAAEIATQWLKPESRGAIRGNRKWWQFWR